MLLLDSMEGYNAVTINTGVVPHTALSKNKVEYGNHSFFPGYDEAAFLPKRNWRQLNNREIALLKPTGKRTDTNTVYIGTIPNELRCLFEKLQLTACTNREEVYARFRNAPEATAEINKATDTFLRSKSNGKPYHLHYLGTNLPNLEVTASDTTRMPKGYKEEDKKYMGIHNDGTRYVSPYRLHTSGNRFTINLGREPRSFLFVNLTMPQALNMLKQKMDIKKQRVDITNIARYFFTHYPDYPVIKITQQPYQYYIAPTDNCFHDGSTLGTRELDIIIVYFGAFCF